VKIKDIICKKLEMIYKELRMMVHVFYRLFRGLPIVRGRE